jgi:thiamine-monophosphate kinase
MSVEGIHFDRRVMPWSALGYKALAISLSDIAAMGGTPRYALVSLGLPGETNVSHVEALYRSMMRMARSEDVLLVGGNITSAPVVIIDTVVVGTAPGPDRVLKRSGARDGDLIAVTGYLGAAAAGYRMLAGRLVFDPATTRALTESFQKPAPKIMIARLLVQSRVRAAIDVSDGLVQDLRHICEQSRVSALLNVDLVPVHPAVKTAFPDQALPLAMSGGEDYELLFTAAPEVMRRLETPEWPGGITVIGRVISGDKPEVILTDSAGKPYELPKTGWEHFKSK